MCQYGERRPVRNAELPINVVQVDLHGPLGQPQASRNFPVRYTLGEHEHDWALASRKWLMRPMSSFCYFSHVKMLHRMFPVIRRYQTNGAGRPEVPCGFGCLGRRSAMRLPILSPRKPRKGPVNPGNLPSAAKNLRGNSSRFRNSIKSKGL